MSGRTVFCSKFQREEPGLNSPPFAGELGEEIYKKVSAEAWRQWNEDVMIKIINEYRLDLSDEQQYSRLLEQMRAYLGLNAEGEVLAVENEKRGKGF